MVPVGNRKQPWQSHHQGMGSRANGGTADAIGQLLAKEVQGHFSTPQPAPMALLEPTSGASR